MSHLFLARISGGQVPDPPFPPQKTRTTCKRANRTIKTAPGEPAPSKCCATLTHENIHVSQQPIGEQVGCSERKWSPGAGEARRSRWCPLRRLQMMLALHDRRLPASKRVRSVTCHGALKAVEAFKHAGHGRLRLLLQRRRVYLTSARREGRGRLRFRRVGHYPRIHLNISLCGHCPHQLYHQLPIILLNFPHPTISDLYPGACG